MSSPQSLSASLPARPLRACGHAVQFYETDPALIDMLARHFGPALASGDTAILVATPGHRDALAAKLTSRGLNLSRLRRTRHYIEIDAAEALAALMVQGWPDRDRFEATLGVKIARAEALAGKHGLIIFGEMVSLLWAQGRHDATVRLEQLWNDFAERHSFFLFCGYPLNFFSDGEHRQSFFNICGEHTHINPAESHKERENENRSCRAATIQTTALSDEIRLSRERTLLLQNAASGGTWELDLSSDIFTISSSAAKLLNLRSNRVSLPTLLGQMYYSGDRDSVSAGLQQAYTGRKTFAATFRVCHGESTLLLEIRGKTFYNAGSPLMLGVLLDVTPDAAAA